MLKCNGLFCSMGVAAAGDNTRLESFHPLLQNSALDTKGWEMREELPPCDRPLDPMHRALPASQAQFRSDDARGI